MTRLLVGGTQVVVGLLIALFPLFSVSRLPGQVLHELPIIPDAEAIDTHARVGALFDDDFVLATRTYTGVDAEPIRSTLVAAGFESRAIDGELWFARECCGEYDEVWVRVGEPDLNGHVEATLTVADDDVRTAAGLFALIGLALFVPGLLIALSGLLRPRASSDAGPSGDDDAEPALTR